MPTMQQQAVKQNKTPQQEGRSADPQLRDPMVQLQEDSGMADPLTLQLATMGSSGTGGPQAPGDGPGGMTSVAGPIQFAGYVEKAGVDPSDDIALMDLIVKKFKEWKGGFLVFKGKRRKYARALYQEIPAKLRPFFRDTYRTTFNEDFSENDDQKKNKVDTNTSKLEADRAKDSDGEMNLHKVARDRLIELSKQVKDTESQIIAIRHAYISQMINDRERAKHLKNKLPDLKKQLASHEKTAREWVFSHAQNSMESESAGPDTEQGKLSKERAVNAAMQWKTAKDESDRVKAQIETFEAELDKLDTGAAASTKGAAYSDALTKKGNIEQEFSEVQNVMLQEKAYAQANANYNALADKFGFLNVAGSSSTLGANFTLNIVTGGTIPLINIGFEAGASVSVGVEGSLSAGDDRKVRASLTFSLAIGPKFDIGVWKASASVGISFTLTKAFSGVEHFVAHLSGVLAEYGKGTQAYAEAMIKKIEADEEAERRRTQLMEAAELDEGSSQRSTFNQIKALRNKQATDVKTIGANAGAETEVNVGFAKAGAALSGSVSASRFTKSITDEEGRTNKYKKTSTNKEVKGSLSFSICGGAATVTLTGKYNDISGHAVEDNDGEYINLKIGITGGFGHEMQSPEAAAAQATSGSLMIDGALNDLSGTENAILSKDNFLKSAQNILQGTSIGELPFDSVSIGGKRTYNIEWNLVKSNGAFTTQYVRSTMDKEFQVAVKGIPLFSIGAASVTMDTSFKKSSTEVGKEIIGSKTISYMETAWHGFNDQPNPDKKWGAWVASNRGQVEKILVNLATPGSNVAKEAPQQHAQAMNMVHGHPIQQADETAMALAKRQVATAGVFTQILGLLVARFRTNAGNRKSKMLNQLDGWTREDA